MNLLLDTKVYKLTKKNGAVGSSKQLKIGQNHFYTKNTHKPSLQIFYFHHLGELASQYSSLSRPWSILFLALVDVSLKSFHFLPKILYNLWNVDETKVFAKCRPEQVPEGDNAVAS